MERKVGGHLGAGLGRGLAQPSRHPGVGLGLILGGAVFHGDSQTAAATSLPWAFVHLENGGTNSKSAFYWEDSSLKGCPFLRV